LASLIVAGGAAAQVFHLGRHAQTLILELLDFGHEQGCNRIELLFLARIFGLFNLGCGVGLRLIVFAALAFIAHGVDVLSVVMSV
jgi:hypothetical protein